MSSRNPPGYAGGDVRGTVLSDRFRSARDAAWSAASTQRRAHAAVVHRAPLRQPSRV